MKILTDKYPMGSLPNQHTAGRYIDETYYENLKILAEVITNDMTFMAVISSSTLEVGTGKSVFVQHTAEAWISLLKEIHNIDLPELTMKNIVFKPKDLITRAFDVPQYSVVIVDEWDDAHYWSELGVSLRQFFRKCRQLNLFIILVIPNFFQLPINYAVSRSVFFVDVRFEGKFERGFFRFYSFKKKKDLYIYGKKTQNYECVKPDFIGRFTNGYVVDEKQYRAAKMKDMIDSEKEVKKPTELQIKAKILRQIREKLPQLTPQLLAEIFHVNDRTCRTWLNDDKIFDGNSNNSESVGGVEYNNNINQDENNLGEEAE
jgi:DNA-binding transcriptional regulator YiaG